MLKLRDLLIFLIYFYLVDSRKIKLMMPGVTTSNSDEYICSSFHVPNANMNSYVLSYEPVANSSIAHHMLLFGCNTPFSTEPSYPCRSICEDSNEKILFAWAKDAKKFEYPSNTGMAIGGKTNINYFVLQVHYLKPSTVKDNSGLILELTTESPDYVVGILLVFSYYGVIPPKTRNVHLDISCRYKGNTEAYTLAFRTHTHSLGRSISGFKVSVIDDQIDFIGKGNPQWPQTFYKAAQVLIKPDDILMVRCLFDSSNRDTVTQIGSTHMDEMCNFYIMMVTKNTGEDNSFLSCGGNEFKDLWKNIPSFSMEFDPPNPSPELQLSKSTNNYNSNFKILKVDKKWKVNRRVGEISGISILNKKSKSEYSLLVLHRGSHTWTSDTFSENVYQGNSPISDSVILEIDPVTGNVLRDGGSNLFFMPHGITATKDGKYIWITDVGLHQVMRFKIRDDSQLIEESPSIILGERLVPGNDKNHFCKPSKVAVDSRGYIFVADGYCNQRVVCFSSNGTFIDDWRTKEPMFIVHSITIEEDPSGDVSKNVVWVADRENRKVIGFSYDGNIKFSISLGKSSLPVYGIEFNPFNKLIYGITTDGENRGSSFTFNTTTLSKMESWNNNYEFRSPHDLCLAENGNIAFVAELHLKTVIKFHLDSPHTNHHHIMDKTFNQIPYMVKQVNPVYIGVSLMAVTFFMVFCILIIKYYRRCHSTSGKKRRYGRAYKDKEGFQPLTQEDDGNDDGNSDPETEEYATPRGHPLRKPKV